MLKAPPNTGQPKRNGLGFTVVVDQSNGRRALGLRMAIVGALFGIALLPASVSFAATVAPSGVAGAKKNVATFGTQTASASKPDNRGYFDFGAGAGGRIFDHVAIINYSTQTITLILRPVDAVNTPQGGFAALPINQRSTDIGTWIALPKADLTVVLPPRTDLIVPFEVEVPANASPGDHIGVLTATLVSSVVGKGQKVTLLQTLGTRVFLRVSGPVHPSFAVKNVKVHYDGTLNPIGTGKAVISYTVTNTGNVALGGRQTVYVSGLFGSKEVAVRTQQIQLLLPGFSVNERITVSHVIPEILDRGHVSITPLYTPGSVEPATGPFKATVKLGCSMDADCRNSPHHPARHRRVSAPPASS